MNILFVMKHRGNAGNTHAVANYMRVGAAARPRGRPSTARPIWYAARAADAPPTSDPLRPQSSTCSSPRLHRIKRLQEAAMLEHVPAGGPADPRHGRHVQSRDLVDGYDRNHATRPSAPRWIEHFDALADRVIKPTHRRRRATRASTRCRSTGTIRRSRSSPSAASAQEVRHPPRRPQLVALEGRCRASCCRPSRQIRDKVGEIALHRPVVGRAAGRGPGGRAGGRPSSRTRRRSGGCGSRRRSPSCTTR